MISKSGFRGEATHSTSTIQQVLHQIGQPTALNTAARILQDSQQVGGSLPLSLDPTHHRDRQLRNLIVVDDVVACDFLGRTVPAVTIPRQLGYELQLIDRHTPKTLENDDYLVATRSTLLQLFIRGTRVGVVLGSHP